MPIIKSAIKKVRKDKTRTKRNAQRSKILKELVKKARRDNSPKNLQAVFSALDKAVKVNLIHQNKSNRLKSRLAKQTLPQQSQPKAKAKLSKVSSRKSGNF